MPALIAVPTTAHPEHPTAKNARAIQKTASFLLAIQFLLFAHSPINPHTHINDNSFDIP